MLRCRSVSVVANVYVHIQVPQCSVTVLGVVALRDGDVAATVRGGHPLGVGGVAGPAHGDRVLALKQGHVVAEDDWGK